MDSPGVPAGLLGSVRDLPSWGSRARPQAAGSVEPDLGQHSFIYLKLFVFFIIAIENMYVEM